MPFATVNMPGHYARTVERARVQGRKAALDPHKTRLDNPYKMYDHRTAWREAFDAVRNTRKLG